MEKIMFKNVHQKIASIFSPLTPAVLGAFNILTLLLLGWLDMVTGDYSLIVFYLIPVSLAAWFISKSFGVLFCFLAVAVRIVVEESTTSFDFSHSTLHYWNELVEFLFLLIMSVLFSALKTNLQNEKTLASHDRRYTRPFWRR